MNTLDAILTRRSCREFTDKPIKSETLHQLLEAAMSGPSCQCTGLGLRGSDRPGKAGTDGRCQRPPC